SKRLIHFGTVQVSILVRFGVPHKIPRLVPICTAGNVGINLQICSRSWVLFEVAKSSWARSAGFFEFWAPHFGARWIRRHVLPGDPRFRSLARFGTIQYYPEDTNNGTDSYRLPGQNEQSILVLL